MNKKLLISSILIILIVGVVFAINQKQNQPLKNQTESQNSLENQKTPDKLEQEKQIQEQTTTKDNQSNPKPTTTSQTPIPPKDEVTGACGKLVYQPGAEGFPETPLVNTKVEAINQEGQVVATAESDSMGKFKILLPAGKYTIKETAYGQTAGITVIQGQCKQFTLYIGAPSSGR